MNTSIDGRLFEWDDEKAAINFRKHGIKFQTAAKVFNDPYRFEKYDDAHSTGEDRWKVIGMVNKLLFVIYTERGERTRLISAREAEPEERREYYGNRVLLLAEECGTDGGGES